MADNFIFSPVFQDIWQGDNISNTLPHIKTIKILYVLEKFYPAHLFNLCQALKMGGKILGYDVKFFILSLEKASVLDNSLSNVSDKLINGSFDKPWDIPASELIAELKQVDAIYINQCFSYAGLYIAAHARLLGKCIIGALTHPHDQNFSELYEVNYLFDFFHTNSISNANQYKKLKNIKIIRDPVDTDYDKISNLPGNKTLESFGQELLTHITAFLQ